MTSAVAIVIFAKYPQAGRVKTRLAISSAQTSKPLSLDHVAALYRAFLLDYVHRFSSSAHKDWQVFFCLRPGPEVTAFQQEISRHQIQIIEEPEYAGRMAVSIGESMGFTIRACLAQGFTKVVILGSDLPHLPFAVLHEALRLLDIYPLVLGNDGGGCYLVAASEIAESIEDSSIVWSQGVDFEAICRIQHGLQKSVGVVSEIWQDVDQIEDVHQLCRDLQQEKIPWDRIPHTAHCLCEWGWISKPVKPV